MHIFTLIESLLMSATSSSKVHLLLYPLLLANFNYLISCIRMFISCVRSRNRLQPIQHQMLLVTFMVLAWERITCIFSALVSLTNEDMEGGLGFPLTKRLFILFIKYEYKIYVIVCL